MTSVELTVEDDGIALMRVGSETGETESSARLRAQFTGAVDRIAADDRIGGVVVQLLGGKFHPVDLPPTTHSGAKVLFEQMSEFKSALRTLERLSVPVIAALEGDAIGGALEIALSCHSRISSQSAKLGLDQRKYGLIPGAGGIVRTTKLVGLAAALPILLGDEVLSADDARELGLIDDVIAGDQALIDAARNRIARWNELPGQPWDRKAYRIPGGDAASAELAALLPFLPIEILRKYRGLEPAPARIVVTATEAARLDIDTALRVETRQWVSAAMSPEARNMIYADEALRRAAAGSRRPTKSPTAFEPEQIGIVGAGMMGAAIAHVCAGAGLQVCLTDRTRDLAERGKEYSTRLLAAAVAKGRLSQTEMERWLGRIAIGSSFSELRDCDIVIEAVFEDLDLKQALLAELQPLLRDDALWGTNTSMLPISRLATAGCRPGNFIGIHFFSPVEKMQLVEVIQGDQTSEQTLSKALDFVEILGKTPIVVNDSLGFFTSRVFSSQLIEGAKMLLEGIHPLRIDAAGRAAGLPVGPLAVSDEVSLKLIVDVRKTQLAHGFAGRTATDQPEAYALVKELVEEHHRQGRAYGGGYYDYRDGKRYIWPPLLSRYHRSDVEISDRDLQDRILYRAVVETLLCLEEGVLNCAEDANVGSLLGIGAPRHTGGYVQFVNGFGLEAFASRCDELADRYGERFACPQIVRKHIALGQPLQ